MTPQEQNIIALKSKIEACESDKRSIIIRFFVEIGFLILLVLFFTSDYYNKLILGLFVDGTKIGGVLGLLSSFLQDIVPLGATISGVGWIIKTIVDWNQNNNEHSKLSTQLQKEINSTAYPKAFGQRIQQHQWRCSCGRIQDKNISSCVCGMSQREMRIRSMEQTKETAKES